METDEELAAHMMRGMQNMSMALLAEDLEGANKGFLEFMGTFVRALNSQTIDSLGELLIAETQRRLKESANR